MAFFFLSQVLGRRICNAQGEPIAKINDVVARLERAHGDEVKSTPHPPVSGLVVKVGHQEVFVPWSQVASFDTGGARLNSARLDLRAFERREGEVLLRRDVPDRRLIDVDGRRVIRANDLQLYGTGKTVRVMAVDSGGEALLRRLSFGRLFVKTNLGRRRPTGKPVDPRRRRVGPVELINWPDIEPRKAGAEGVRLRLPHDRLALLNPVDLANIVDDLGLEAGLDHRWREAPVFCGLLSLFVGSAAVLVLIPGLPLIQVMFLSQVLNGLLLPIILVFVFLLAGNRRLMGSLASGRVLLWAGWLVTVAVSVMSVVYVVSSITG